MYNNMADQAFTLRPIHYLLVNSSRNITPSMLEDVKLIRALENKIQDWFRFLRYGKTGRFK